MSSTTLKATNRANCPDVAAYLDSIRHKHLNLSVDGNGSCNRPDLQLWPAANEDIAPAIVTVSIGSLLGQQPRYIDLTPDEARTLAQHLLAFAAIVETA